MTGIIKHIESWMDSRENNALEPKSEIQAFSKPLIGFASGDDDLFSYFKIDIGYDFYWTPKEAFTIAFPGEKVQPNELSVVSWVLPHTESTRIAHRKAKDLPSIEWSKARHYGEKVNENLRTSVVNWFLDQGYMACAPVLLPEWSKVNSPKYGFASCWSERHVAHVCGLGTFGLSDGLISPLGKAIRVGSIVVRKKYLPTPRKYKSHNEWCLFQATGKCLACMRRCPAGAISEKGHDKFKCRERIRNVAAVHVKQEQLGFKVNSCGLCQTKVPCEFQNPIAKTNADSSDSPE